MASPSSSSGTESAVCVLSDSDWSSVLSSFHSRVDSEYSHSQNDSVSKRKLYAEIELKRMDWEDDPKVSQYLYDVSHVDSVAKKALEESSEGKKIEKFKSEWDALRARFDLRNQKKKSPISQKFYQGFRLSIAILYFFLQLPVCYMLSSLRLIHPLLRRFGIPNGRLPVDIVQMYFARAQLYLAGISVAYEGLDYMRNVEQCIGMYIHSSNLDPFLVGSAPYAFKFVGKKILFQTPLLGWLFTLYGHIPIDRGNRAAAIGSLGAAGEMIKKYKRSIAISPEGTRSKSGRLQEFKKGAFHLAVEHQLPVVPILIEGAYQCFPPHYLFSMGGEVKVKFLPKLELKPGENYNELLKRTRRYVLTSLASPANSVVTSEVIDTFWAFIFFLAFYVAGFAAYIIFF